MLRHVSPAGAPIRIADLARWAGLAVSTRDASSVLRAEVRARFGVGHCYVTSTGRAGLTLLLKAMRRLAPANRDEVVVPSYTCYSVAASVVKAGLRPRIVDISPETLDYAPDQLAHTGFERVLAIVATNLYGLPSDMPALCRTAREQGVFLIDDAAQAMGASVGGRLSGTWGDAGLFSFDKGKNVSAIDGGVVVTNSDDVAAALKREMDGLSSPGFAQSGVDALKALAYFAMLRPWLYWVPNGIPQLGLGRTVFSTDFPLQQSSRPLVALAASMIGNLQSFTRTRVLNAAKLLNVLKDLPGVRTINPHEGASPVYLRLPILVAGATARKRALDALQKAGIGATASYPASLSDVVELQDHLARPTSRAIGGRDVAARLLTLPTHPFVTNQDVDRMLAALSLSLNDSVGSLNGVTEEGAA